MIFSKPISATFAILARMAEGIAGLGVFLFCLHIGLCAQAAEAPWAPAPGVRFDVQFSEPFDRDQPVDVMELDLFDTTPEDIARLKARGVHMVCYLNAGAWEDWRNDASEFPPEIIGKAYEGWEGERWLDIRAIDALTPILTARMDLCRDKGFEAVDPDNVNGHDNPTGFALTQSDQVRFNRWLAQLAHERGLSIALKNASDLWPQLADVFDWTVTEDCFDQHWCRDLLPIAQAGKAVFAIEYTDQLSDRSDDWRNACKQARNLGITMLLKNRNLDGFVRHCK